MSQVPAVSRILGRAFQLGLLVSALGSSIACGSTIEDSVGGEDVGVDDEAARRRRRDAGSDATPVPTTTPTTPPTPGAWWKPAPGTSWQWQLQGTVDTSFNVAMYDIDLFDSSTTIISGLHARGIKVVCYFSAGTWEDWRPDAAQYPTSVRGSGVDGWPGEKWFDIRSPAVRQGLSARLAMAKQKGCDGVEPDNVDGYTNKPGFPLTASDQIDFNKWLATTAHSLGLTVGLKNDPDQAAELEPYFDFELDEQCFQYDECGAFAPFIKAGKAVFEVEYGSASKATTVCPKAKAAKFDTLIKNLSLDATRTACQ